MLFRSKAVVCLFILDVGLRRVDIDREEWARWMDRNLARFGLGGGRRAVEAQEAMSALLARKSEVRSRHAEQAEPAVVVASARTREDLFKPAHMPASMDAGATGANEPTASAPESKAGPDAGQGKEPAEGTSRLLEAKRRAQRKR